jgi:uncharacterized membrane protein YkvA (DUF1232 family)
MDATTFRRLLVTGIVTAIALIYLASPIDLIPDFIPVIGQLDDLAVLITAVSTVLRQWQESDGS